MKQLTPAKKRKLLASIRQYHKRYMGAKYTQLDESATRLMINSFLTDVLGLKGLDEVKTEYMIRGTYADYIVQLTGKQHFIVEVKSLGLDLSEKHLRQAVNYAANEGIEWALLTNGRVFQLYRILFTKPIQSRRVFEFDLSNRKELKRDSESLQYLTRGMLGQKGLDTLWHRYSALDPQNVAKLLVSKPVLRYVRRELRRSHKTKFTDDEIRQVIAALGAGHAASTPEVKGRRRVKHRKVRKPQGSAVMDVPSSGQTL